MLNPLNLWRGFLARPNDDHIKVFGVALLVAMISAAFVSTAAVALKPLQDAHLEAERAARMAQMLDTLPGLRAVMEEAGVDTLETRVVDLATGAFVPDIDPADYDVQAAASDPEQSTAIPPDVDVAGLRRRADYALVHLLERDGALLLIVLPVEGTGYQSTIRAMLALEPDLNTIAALTITEQGETPGIGARVEDAAWLALWPGRQVADEDGNIVISVVRGTATGPYQVDAISGATVTSNGVANMLRYWLGDHGYGPFLDRLTTEGL
ncbi:NADH:ubiquinone reductase (Na(+)-transporting) subunit C [Yoonia sp. F2084L]|uniref:NADH:ubiquinone reductase (Na(+)-transporting) subunit C n=1 Tax=Yoonia sp. F2084L TaxID=2926419 RepID=UPI001FF0F70D|nr:NADH:ubiquinone reductase (Na(+)-transporting) subunit C [Yoonia sp. F2084L]MCK0097357.1 NADH:ubiquinone reductase (Na(+)-transporting) subunit C [Yoonia sp. F2084L]